MERVLVDEELLDHRLIVDGVEVGHFQEEPSARRERRRDALEHAPRRTGVFEGVRTVDEVEARRRDGRLLETRDLKRNASGAAIGVDDALVRLDGRDRGVRMRLAAPQDEVAAVGADVEHATRTRPVDLALEHADGVIEADAFAVTHVSPVGAAAQAHVPGRGARARRTALRQAARAAHVHDHAGRRVRHLVRDLRRAAAEVAGQYFTSYIGLSIS
jgi:hypothetical protein